jgi:hypothetical protein
MSSLISDELRLLVKSQADRLCEYCLTHEDDGLFADQIDHIISIKHGGATELENLALACIFCNRQKGSDVGTILADGSFTRFFHPRTDSWAEHFRLAAAMIEPITTIGYGTVCILRFNDTKRIAESEELIARGRYPTLQALARMNG